MATPNNKNRTPNTGTFLDDENQIFDFKTVLTDGSIKVQMIQSTTNYYMSFSNFEALNPGVTGVFGGVIGQGTFDENVPPIWSVHVPVPASGTITEFIGALSEVSDVDNSRFYQISLVDYTTGLTTQYASEQLLFDDGEQYKSATGLSIPVVKGVHGIAVYTDQVAGILGGWVSASIKIEV